jgi:hypothetical protein
VGLTGKRRFVTVHPRAVDAGYTHHLSGKFVQEFLHLPTSTIEHRMTLLQQISKGLREVYFGGNWTGVNVKDTLEGISWEEATTRVDHLNTIAMLVFHINYYVTPVLDVLKGEPLKASDKLSFELPPLRSAEDWQQLVTKVLTDAELLAAQIEQLDETLLSKDFAGPAYGTYYRNLTGVIEHTHYHLGQISLIRKLLRQGKGHDE